MAKLSITSGSLRIVSGSWSVGAPLEYSAVILADGPVGYWRHEDSSGNLVDSSGNGHTLTAVGSLTYSLDGQVDNAIDYSTGGGDRAEITDAASASAFDFADDLTIECWVFPIGAQQSQAAILSKNDASGGVATNNYDFSWQAGGTRPRMGVNVDPNVNFFALATSTPAACTWFHLVGTREGTSLRIYLDGILEASTTIPASALTDTNRNLTLGAFHNGSFNLGHNGRLDEVAVYASALSSARVAAHFNAGV